MATEIPALQGPRMYDLLIAPREDSVLLYAARTPTMEDADLWLSGNEAGGPAYVVRCTLCGRWGIATFTSLDDCPCTPLNPPEDWLPYVRYLQEMWDLGRVLMPAWGNECLLWAHDERPHGGDQ